jgi:hypothetical protein
MFWIDGVQLDWTFIAMSLGMVTLMLLFKAMMRGGTGRDLARREGRGGAK